MLISRSYKKSDKMNSNKIGEQIITRMGKINEVKNNTKPVNKLMNMSTYT